MVGNKNKFQSQLDLVWGQKPPLEILCALWCSGQNQNQFCNKCICRSWRTSYTQYPPDHTFSNVEATPANELPDNPNL